MKNLSEIVEGEDIVTKDYLDLGMGSMEIDVTYTSSTKDLALAISAAEISNADMEEF